MNQYNNEGFSHDKGQTTVIINTVLVLNYLNFLSSVVVVLRFRLFETLNKNKTSEKV